MKYLQILMESMLKRISYVAIANTETLTTKMFSALWFKSSGPDQVRGKKSTQKRNIIYLFACQALPLGQQPWHTARVQQMFDDELHKNMTHVECVKIKIVLGLGGNKISWSIIFLI